MDKIVNLSEFIKNQDDDKYYIYLHLTKDDNIPFYIGKGKKHRCLDKKGRSIWWNNVSNKYNYIIKILEFNLSEDDAYDKEIYWIKSYGRKNLKEGGTLVNLTDGGDGVRNRIFSKSEKEKLSKLWKNNFEKWNQIGERKKYFGKQLFGENNPNFGNIKSKNPLSKSVVKLSLKEEFIEKYSSIKECAEINNVASNSISACCKGKRYQLKGFLYFYFSDYESGNYEVKVGKNSKKIIYKLDLKTNEILKIYNSASETKIDGFNPTNVGQVCLGKKKSHKGFKWIFEKDYE